jgi:chitinase
VFAYLLQFSTGGTEQIAELDFDGIDVLIHAFLEPFADGSIAPLSPFDDYRTAGLPETVHSAGSKILFSVGGANHSIRFKDSIGPNPAVRLAFADNVVDAINTWGYDGVDIDYEFPTDANEKENHREIMKAVYEAVKANNPEHLVAFGVSPGYWLPDFDWAGLGQWTDYAVYFCYDWNMPANGPITNPGVNFTMHGGEQIEASCAGAIRYMVDGGFPPEKIIVALDAARGLYGDQHPKRLVEHSGGDGAQGPGRARSYSDGAQFERGSHRRCRGRRVGVGARGPSPARFVPRDR